MGVDVQNNLVSESFDEVWGDVLFLSHSTARLRRNDPLVFSRFDSAQKCRIPPKNFRDVPGSGSI